MPILYSFFSNLLQWLLPVVSIFNKKWKKWYINQRYFLESFTQIPQLNKEYLWVHCASAGEMEQAIPLIKRIKINHPELKVAVSFFSASGYDMYKLTDFADSYFYFPLDTKKNIKRIIELLHPKAVVFVRSELWLNTLVELQNQQIPSFLINAKNDTNSHSLKHYYYNYCIKRLTRVFYTDEFGNTKLEKALENRNSTFVSDVLEYFTKDKFTVLVGSSWQAEEKFVLQFLSKYSDLTTVNFVIAPHELDEHRLRDTFDFNSIQFYSHYDVSKTSNIMVLDTKGILKYAYRFTNMAFIGGGFDKTLHNSIEAFVYAIPVLVGPSHHKFEEVKVLLVEKLILEVKNFNEFEQALLDYQNDKSKNLRLQENIEAYLQRQGNSSEKIYQEIKPYLA